MEDKHLKWTILAKKLIERRRDEAAERSRPPPGMNLTEVVLRNQASRLHMQRIDEFSKNKEEVNSVEEEGLGAESGGTEEKSPSQDHKSQNSPSMMKQNPSAPVIDHPLAIEFSPQKERRGEAERRQSISAKVGSKAQAAAAHTAQFAAKTANAVTDKTNAVIKQGHHTFWKYAITFGESMSECILCQSKDHPELSLENYPTDRLDDAVTLAKFFDFEGGFANGGMGANRYSHLKDKEKAAIQDTLHMSLMTSIGLLVPNGTGGVLGAEKYLRARVTNQWRKKLQDLAKAEKMLCGGGTNHRLVRVRGKLPYFIWPDRTVVKCCIKGCKTLDLSLDRYYYHCSYNGCSMDENCSSCAVDLRVNDELMTVYRTLRSKGQPEQEMMSTQEDDGNVSMEQIMRQEAEHPTSVASCPKICQTTICRSCFGDIIESNTRFESVDNLTCQFINDAVKKRWRHPSRQLNKYKVDRQSALKTTLAAAQEKRHSPSYNQSSTSFRNSYRASIPSMVPLNIGAEPQLGRKSFSVASEYDDDEKLEEEAHASLEDYERLIKNYELREASRGHKVNIDTGESEKHKLLLQNKYQRIYQLHKEVSEDPETYFPYLDAYSVIGIPNSHNAGGSSSFLVALMVFLTQVGVPLILMLTVREQWNWKSQIKLGMGDDTSKEDREEACDEYALNEVEETLFPLGTYRYKLSCAQKEDDKSCADYYCTVDMPSLCDRTGDRARRLVGFFLVGTLCLSSAVKFWAMFRSYTYQAEALLLKLVGRNLMKPERPHIEEGGRYGCNGCFRHITWVDCFKHWMHTTFECCTRLTHFHKAMSEDERRAYVDSISANLLFPIFAVDDVPEGYVEQLIDTVIKYKLPMPYKLCFILKEMGRSSCGMDNTHVAGHGPESYDEIEARRRSRPNFHLSPGSIVTSVCLNYIVLAMTLMTSLYICVQSATLTDLVLNTVALEFLLTLDDNCIDRNKALLQIKLIAQSAAKQLVREGVCSSDDPMVIKQLEDELNHIEFPSEITENQAITRDAIGKLQGKRRVLLKDVQKMTPGLVMISNYHRAIYSPITMKSYIMYYVDVAWVAYEVCREVFVMETLKAMVHFDIFKFLSTVPSSVAALGFFGAWLFLQLYRLAASLFFLPLYVPVMLIIWGCYITGYATYCI